MSERRFQLTDYVDVQERIREFWDRYPDGAIRTRLESLPDDFSQCRYSARVFKDRNSVEPDATGWAFEIAGGSGANRTSHEENCETSAIGRALANMGFATSLKDRPSRQEMRKVTSSQTRQDAPHAANGTAEASQDPAFASQRQIGFIGALAKEKGLTEADWRAEMERRYGVESRTALTRKDASAFIDYLNTLPSKGGQPPAAIAAEQGIVDWTAFWREVEREGWPRDKDGLERAIGPLGANPQEALSRFQAHIKDQAKQASLTS